MEELLSNNSLFLRLSKSKFRSSFNLNDKDILYINEKGIETIKKHAFDFLNARIKVYNPLKDGKQTPYKGHVVFKAQHATATCCRGCIEKWYHFPKDITLNDNQIAYLVSIIMEWINNQYNLKTRDV